MYKYETHLHTCESSACGVSSGAEMAEFHKLQGYTGIFVTDHFLNGNTAVPRNLPWEERIELFCKGYENAKKKGDEIGLQVFFGWEYSDRAIEFLTYNLDKRFLLDNPDLIDIDIHEYFRRVHAAGGFISHAHPFRERDYIPEQRFYPDEVDAVEAINIGNDNELFDIRATEFAEKSSLPCTSGTDIHDVRRFASGGMEFDHVLSDPADFARSVKAYNYTLLKGRDYPYAYSK